MELDFSKLNSILGSFYSLRNNKKISKEVKVDDDQSYEIYHIAELGIWIRLEMSEDSYGGDDRINGITFVKPVEKTHTVYEKL